MGRYIFTEQDFGPFRIFLEHPLAQEALAATVPIKQLVEPELHLEPHARLPVDVQSLEKPDGVPLHQVLSAIQEHAPHVRGLVVRNGNLIVMHGEPPEPAVRSKIAAVLKDPQLLNNMRAATREVVPADAMIRKLTDENTPDAEWIKMFREYAVKFLIKRQP